MKKYLDLIPFILIFLKIFLKGSIIVLILKVLLNHVTSMTNDSAFRESDVRSCYKMRVIVEN